MPLTSLGARLGRTDWPKVEASLWERPYARLGRLLTAAECRDLIALYDDDHRFRSRIDMERHRFGVGEYKYFASPLPPLVQELRAARPARRRLPSVIAPLSMRTGPRA